jgi:hypothetical protein
MRKYFKHLVFVLVMFCLLAINNVKAVETQLTATEGQCPSVIIDNITYALSPCEVTTEMVDGQGDKNFSFTITQKNEKSFYGFGVYGYGVGFPDYGVQTITSGGGAIGDFVINGYFDDKALQADGSNEKKYQGYLPINVYHGSATGNTNKHELRFNIKLTVKPGVITANNSDLVKSDLTTKEVPLDSNVSDIPEQSDLTVGEVAIGVVGKDGREAYDKLPVDGDNIRLAVKIKNIGKGETNKSYKIHWNIPGVSTRSQTFGSTLLSAGVMTTYSLPDTKNMAGEVIPVKAGVYEAVITVDHENEIVESNENNNTFTKTIKVLDKAIDYAPLISNVEISSIDANSAIVSWVSLVPHISYIMFDNFAVGSTTTRTVKNDISTTNHKLKLTELHPNIKYYFEILSKATTGNIVASKTYSFTTKADTKEDQNINIDFSEKCKLTMDNVSYYLSPCEINEEMIDGQGDKYFNFKIIGGPSYNFAISGYGVGFPVYGILGESSGGASGDTTINPYFNDSYLQANGNSEKIYQGYLPVRVYLSSATGSDENTLRLKIKLTVKPNEKNLNNKPKEQTKPTITSEEQIKQITTNATRLHDSNFDAILDELNKLRDTVKEQASKIKYLESLTKDIKQISEQAIDTINHFITYGVDTNTEKLGAGERAAVMSSFKQAFNKLPETEEELSDAIKIASGRWPSNRNEDAEKKAKEQFKKIYKRIPDMNDSKDNAAVTVMTYGLRQKAENRNLESEKKGIVTFKNIYGHNPKETEDWNIMQAITYSGSARGADSDKDYLTDAREAELGTNPNNKDSDGDGFLDGDEVNSGFDPLKK